MRDGSDLRMTKYFTIDEANAALVVIRPWIDEILLIRDEIMQQKPEVWPVIQKAAGNGGSAAASNLAQNFERLDRLVHQIQDAGALIKDLNTGLLDFPALRNGYEVYLCWRLGEGDIAFWHEVDAGFAGRQPIETF
jgi:hypothetical protein